MAFSERIRLVIDVATGNARGPLRQLSTDLKQADGAFAKTKIAASGLFDSLKANAAGAALAAGGALVGFGAKAVGEFQKVALGAGKLRDSLGVTAEEASRLQEVAGDVGVGVGALEAAIGRMNRAAEATPEAFQAIGAEIQRNADGTINVTETFLSVAEALDNIPDAAKRAEAAQRIFGRGWMQIAELVQGGADGIREAMADVEGAKIISDAEIARAREFRDTLDDLKGTLESVTIAAGGAIVQVTQFVGDIEAGVTEFEDSVERALGAEVTGRIAENFANNADAIAAWGERVHESVRGNADALSAWGDSIHETLDPMRTSAELAKEEADALKEAAEAAQEAADAHTAEADALFATIDARRAAADAQFAANDAVRDFAEEMAGYNELVASGEASMTELAAAQEGVVSSASSAADAAQRLAEEQASANGAALSAAQAGDIWRDSMIEQAGAAGALSGPILDYVATVEGIPPEKLTEIKAMVAAGDLEGAKAALDAASETRTAQIAAEAQVAAATADLNAVASAERVADIVAQAWTQAANEGLNGVAAQNRVAEILAQALTGEANADLNALGPYNPSVIGRYSGTTGIPSSITIPVRLQASGAVAGVRANGMIMNAEGGTAGSRSVAGETGQLEFTGPGAVAAPTFIRPATPITGVRESADLITSLTAAVDRLAATRTAGTAINEDSLARAIGREVRAAIGYRR
jgi:hypothetical protein